MNILVTICARAGSKGVKNKNVRLLHGKPLIAHTIEQALAWGRASRVVVSTDSPEIAAIARQFGAEVPFLRPTELAQDASPKLPSIRHALKKSELLFSENFPVIVDLDPTSPLRSIEDIEGCYQLFLEKKPWTVFSVSPSRRNPYFNMVELSKDGFVQLVSPLPEGVFSRQAAPRVFDMNSAVYVYQRDYILDEKHNSTISEKTLPYIMENSAVIDIDSDLDFEIVEFLMKKMGR